PFLAEAACLPGRFFERLAWGRFLPLLFLLLAGCSACLVASCPELFCCALRSGRTGFCPGRGRGADFLASIACCRSRSSSRSTFLISRCCWPSVHTLLASQYSSTAIGRNQPEMIAPIGAMYIIALPSMALCGLAMAASVCRFTDIRMVKYVATEA